MTYNLNYRVCYLSKPLTSASIRSARRHFPRAGLAESQEREAAYSSSYPVLHKTFVYWRVEPVLATLGLRSS